MPSSPESEQVEEREDADAVEQPEREDGHAAELAELEDRYKRARADLENYRKRADREIERRVAECTESLLREWLEAVDSVERALKTAGGEAAEGLRAVLDQMDAILARHGVNRIRALPGDRFHPELHDAVGTTPPTDEYPDRTIAEVTRSGYMVAGRVLRPAEVIVARRI
jgi:molecular chaperone GrpE